MTFDLPTPAVSIPASDTVLVSDLYPAVTCTAVATPDTITVSVTVTHGFDITSDDRQMGNAQVFVNGVHRDGAWGGPYPPHTFAANYPASPPNTRTFTFAIVRSACPDLIRPGECLVSVRVADGNDNLICYLNRKPILPPRPVAALVPGKVLLAVFWSPTLSEFAASPALVQQLHDAGVNCLTVGFFHNPGDDGATAFDRTHFTATTIPVLDFARANGFRLLLAGDDLCRNAAEQNWDDTAAEAHADVVWVAQQLAGYADVIAGVPLVDEGSDPAVDHHYSLVIGWLREGWPVVKISVPNQSTQAWDQGPLVDYVDRYWATDGTGFENRPSLGEVVTAMNRAADQIGTTRPFVCQVVAMGPFYTKQAAGANYQPGIDTIQSLGNEAYQITAQIWIALANGASGLRCYAFDFQTARDRRADSPVGTANLETGVYPGDDRWPGLAAGYAAVASREAKLLSGFRPPLADGSFLWGYRDQLEWAVNTSEEPAIMLAGGGVLVTPTGEVPFMGGLVPPGGVVIWG